MKPLMNYLDYFKKSNTAVKANVSISWSGAISIDELSNGTLSNANKQIADQKNVIYILMGENTHGKKAIDIGQTSSSLLERTKQHIQDEDYLEGYPNNQMAYCGKVTANICVDRELLEQVEGVIIQHFVANISKNGYYLCNDSKTKECKKSLVRHIVNRNIPNGLKRLLSWFIVIRKTKDEL